jgi:hypothetical protein
MAYTRSIKEIITYPPSNLDTFELLSYEWIDNLNFTLNPKEYLETVLKPPHSRLILIRIIAK